MKIIADKKIPYLRGVLEPYCEVVYLDGDKIDNDACRDCDGMIVRTRTRCNEALLSNSNVQIIATATIGMDHIDNRYCFSRSIEVRNASGCNASAVVQYVMAVMAQQSLEPSKHQIGIIGYGNIGSLLSQKCNDLGFNTLIYDPFKEVEVGEKCESLESLLSRSDLVTIHVPLTREGDHKTFKMADSSFFEMIKKDCIFVNSSRGEVVDELSLLDAIKRGKLSAAAVDVWCNEPNIGLELLSSAKFTTAHIAGYSQRGKERATEMSVRSIARKFGFKELESWQIREEEVYSPMEWSDIKLNMPKYFDIVDQSQTLCRLPESFEQIRNEYSFRKEFF